MSETIPNYIRDYLFGAKPPEGCCVLEGSLPALVEGNLSQANPESTDGQGWTA